MKAAIVVLSDPRSGTEEAFGRVFNALAAAYDFKKRGTPVRVLFQGAGTRWVGELTNVDHPAHTLFEEVRDVVEGVSSACATAFGATEAATSHGFELLNGNDAPGTSGLPSMGGAGGGWVHGTHFLGKRADTLPSVRPELSEGTCEFQIPFIPENDRSNIWPGRPQKQILTGP